MPPVNTTDWFRENMWFTAANYNMSDLVPATFVAYDYFIAL